MQYEAVLLYVSGVMPATHAPAKPRKGVLPTCSAFENQNPSVVSAGNGRHRSRTTCAVDNK